MKCRLSLGSVPAGGRLSTSCGGKATQPLMTPGNPPVTWPMRLPSWQSSRRSRLWSDSWLDAVCCVYACEGLATTTVKGPRARLAPAWCYVVLFWLCCMGDVCLCAGHGLPGKSPAVSLMCPPTLGSHLAVPPGLRVPPPPPEVGSQSFPHLPWHHFGLACSRGRSR